MFNNSWFKKEKPLPGMIGMGGGATNFVNAGGGLAPQIEASGGFVSDVAAPDGTLYRYHVWRSSGSFVVSDVGASDGTIEYFALGGGGCGGRQRGGGGGAGGLQSNMPGITGAHPTTATPAITVSSGTIPVSFGWGGVVGPDNNTGLNQMRGMDTVLTFPTGAITAYGGGQGGGNRSPLTAGPLPYSGSPGGCGGGGGNDGTGNPDPSTPPTSISVGPTGTQGYGGAPIGIHGPNCTTFQYMGTGGGGVGGEPPGSGNARKNYGINPCPAPPTVAPAAWPGGSVSPTATNLTDMGSPGGAGAVITSIDIDATQIGTPGPSSGIWFGGGGGGGCNDGYDPPSGQPLPRGEPPTASPNPTSYRTGGVGGGGQGASGADNGAKGRMWDYFPNGNANPLGFHVNGQDGLKNTGGGGGGGGFEYGGGGGQGGPGIACIRYVISAKQSGTAKATGGLISYTPTHTIHTFLEPGTFTSNAGFSETVEYVCLAGGGQGGPANSHKQVGGGGGAGGYRTGTTPFTTPTSTPMAIIVGEGGVNQYGNSKWFMGPGDYPYSTNMAYKSGPAPGSPSSVVFPTGTIMSDGGGAGGCPTSGSPADPDFSGGTAWPQIDGPTDSQYWYSQWGSPGGSGGGQSGSQVPSPGGSDGPFQAQNYGLGNTRVDYAPDVNPGQGNDGGGNPPTGLNQEDLNMAGGGGGAGGVGGSIPPGPASPPGRSTPQKKSGAGGVGVQIPTTFQNPMQLFEPGPGGNWYVGGGGAGGFNDGTAGPNPEGQDTTTGQPGGYGGGGDANQTFAPPTNPYATPPTGSPNPGGPSAISEASRGVNGCGGGGGGGGSAGPPSVRAIGGYGGSGVIMIAYPT